MEDKEKTKGQELAGQSSFLPINLGCSTKFPTRTPRLS